ncbi:MAG: glycosyltransferase family 39 protein [Rhodocyclaceae bacterium]|nr:glycosyltransferase family 39 protein [Rhodocyclaceae bacterium]
MLFSVQRLFLAAVGLTLVFRLWLATAMPITGDEAYFIWWGQIPDWGFYDHPPLIGWLLAGLLAVGDAEWWLRLPQVVQPVLLALALRWAWPRLWPTQAERRDWVALLVLLAPVNVWNVFVTTDTALVYCAVLSGLAWLFAVRDDALVETRSGAWRWYAVAGIFLAGAILSKYFAALLGFAYLVDTLRRRRSFAGLAITYACTVPALLLMTWWNAGHCWSNYMFNFVNRHGANTGLNWETPLLYVVTLAYVLTPPVLWVMFRRRPTVGGETADRRPPSADFSPVDRSLTTLVVVPLLLFAALSPIKTIGLHWVLAFVPFVLLLAVRRFSGVAVPKLALFFLAFAALHLAVALVISRLPLETWRSLKIYPGLVLTFESRALVARAAAGPPQGGMRPPAGGSEPGLRAWGALNAAAGDSLLASDGYSNAVTLGYNLRRYVPVLGMGSSHARHDDILTDWRTQDGRDITVLRKSAPDQDEYAAWFQNVEIDSFEQRGARFWVVRGRGFDYAAYRDSVLTEVRRRYYALPPWLPQTGCYFCDRYFPGKTCTR